MGGGPTGARSDELVEQGRNRYMLALPLRLRFSPEVETLGDTADVLAGAVAWQERLPEAVAVGAGHDGCEVYVYYDDEDLLARGALARARVDGPCSGSIVLGTGLGSDLPSLFAHELCHLLKDRRADSSEAGSVCAAGWLGTEVAVTDQDAADVLAREVAP